MSEDATLDAFAGSEEGEGDSGPEGSEHDERPEPEDGTGVDGDDEETDRPEPPTLTFTSSPDGDACAECGETVSNRWRAGEGAEDPDALVCPDCKVW